MLMGEITGYHHIPLNKSLYGIRFSVNYKLHMLDYMYKNKLTVHYLKTMHSYVS